MENWSTEKKIQWVIIHAAFRVADQKGNIPEMERLIQKMEEMVKD